MPGLWCVLHGPPGRTEWFSAKARSTLGTPRPYGPRPVRSYIYRSSAPARRPRPSTKIGEWGLRRLGAVREGGVDYAALDLTVPSALVFGNEAAGLPVDLVDKEIDGWVSIPMPGGAESLNVGMAAAVLCFESARQRRFAPPSQSTAPVKVGWPSDRPE